LKRDTLKSFAKEAVSNKVSLLCTDEWKGYMKLDKDYPHGVVDPRQWATCRRRDPYSDDRRLLVVD
jgi:hypothetical protein